MKLSDIPIEMLKTKSLIRAKWQNEGREYFIFYDGIDYICNSQVPHIFLPEDFAANDWRVVELQQRKNEQR